MDASNLYYTLSVSDDWSGYTLKDVRSAIEFGITNDLSPDISESERDAFLHMHGNQIDYLMYLFGLVITLEDDDPSASISEMNRKWENKSLSYNSKSRCKSAYECAFFYKYIFSVELQNLRTIVAINSDGIINKSQAVEFFITGLLFPRVVEEHPGSFISYRDIDGVSARRAASLDNARDAIAIALDTNDMRAMFTQVFCLMTEYPWSVYRNIHSAMGYLLAFSKMEFKEDFLNDLDRIIESKGAVQIW